LLPRVHRNTDRGFLQEAQTRMRDWNSLLEEVEATPRSPLRRFSLFCPRLRHRWLPLRPSQRSASGDTGSVGITEPALVEAVVDANEKPTKPGDLKA
jgi:hypothetical protein